MAGGEFVQAVTDFACKLFNKWRRYFVEIFERDSAPVETSATGEWRSLYCSQ